MNEIAESISTYIGHFRSHLSAIEKLQAAEHTVHYRKLLYVAALDALAKGIYPRKECNRERQVAFLERFSRWKDLHRVSLPHLSRLLAKTPDPAFAKLRRYVRDELSKWPHGISGSPSQDPDIKAVKRHWPSDKEHRYPLEGVALESLQHVHLWVTYRNSLVHEFRSPGHGYEFPSDEPSYIGEFKGEVADESSVIRLLNYPVGFFCKIAGTCLENVETYLLENQINPYSSYIFGDYFLDALNK
jgi:hypothetical protein